MGIFDNLWKKHGHKKDKEIQELLEIIQDLERQNEKIYDDLQKCLQEKKANPVKLAFNFS